MERDNYAVGDFNGDGKADVRDSSGKIWLFENAELVESEIEFAQQPGALGDFNGDGKTDIFVAPHLYLSTGASFQIVTEWNLPTGDGPWYVGDFNGDGNDDLLRVAWGITGGEVHLSSGSGFVGAGGWTGFGPGSQGWYVGDFDGDGRSDLLRVVPGLAGAEVLLSTGDAFSVGTVWTTQGNLGNWIVADMNGDARDDLIDAVGNVLLSNGSNFVSAGKLNFGQDSLIIGFAGLTDVMRPLLVVESGGAPEVREVDLLELEASAAYFIEALPRISYVGKEVTLEVPALKEGHEARFIISGVPSSWSATGTHVFAPTAEGQYSVRVEVRSSQTGEMLAEFHGGRDISVYTSGKGTSASDIARLILAEVQSPVSVDAASMEWRANIHSFSDLYDYVDAASEIHQPNAEPLAKALFILQFVSGMWAYGNKDNPNLPGDVTDIEILGKAAIEDVNISLFMNSPIGNCEDFASVLAFLLTSAGYSNRIVINPSHVFNEVLIDGQWWTFDATFGIAIDDDFETALNRESSPSVLIFPHPSRQEGDMFRERLSSGLHEHLALIENGLFPDTVRMDISTFFNLLEYGNIFTSELDLSGWIPTPTQALAQDPGSLGLVELLALTSLSRLKLVEQNSQVSGEAARSEWRDGVESFGDFADFLFGSLPAGTSETDRALYYMQWVSGIWANGVELSEFAAVDAWSGGSASTQDRSALLAWLFEKAGFQNSVILESGLTLNQVLLDGEWWTLDPTNGIAIRSAWDAAVVASSELDVLIFPVSGRQFGSPQYSAAHAAMTHETLTRLANGSFAGDSVDTLSWLLSNGFGRAIMFEAAFDAGDVGEDDPVMVIDLLRTQSPSYVPIKVTDGSVSVTSSKASRDVAFTLGSNSVSIDPGQFGDLGAGQFETLTITYTVTDQLGAAVTNTTVYVVRGANDQPTTTALDAGQVGEDDPLLVIDLLEGARDADGDVIRITEGSVLIASSNSARVVLFDLSDGNLLIDPGQFSDLIAGQSEELTITYTFTDGIGAAVTNTAVLIVGGGNDQVGYLSAGLWTDSSSTWWYVGDFDGDGLEDIFQYVPGRSGAEIQLSDGREFIDARSWTTAWNGGFAWHVGDFNGDGKADIFRYLLGKSGADMFLSTGESFVADGSWTSAGQGAAGWHIGDFNGDGKDDIFRYVPGVTGSDMFLSTGSSFIRDGSWTGAGHGTTGWLIGDFDGDGKDDILRQISGTSADVFLSNGSDFVRSGSWLLDLGAGGKWSVADVNGDGKDDLLWHVGEQVEVFLSEGFQFVPAGSFAAPSGKFRVGDFNGDGRGDLIFYSDERLPSEVFVSEWIL